MPYAEPAWLSEGYKSTYYNDSHHALQQFMRKFSDEEVYPIAQECEKNGKRVSSVVQSSGVVAGLTRECSNLCSPRWNSSSAADSSTSTTWYVSCFQDAILH